LEWHHDFSHLHQMSEGGYFIVSIHVHGEVQIEKYKLQFFLNILKNLQQEIYCDYITILTSRTLQ